MYIYIMFPFVLAKQSSEKSAKPHPRRHEKGRRILTRIEPGTPKDKEKHDWLVVDLPNGEHRWLYENYMII